MTYQQIVSTSDPDIPHLTSVLNLPEIARFISIDENSFWNYVTENKDVFFFKVYDNSRLVGTTHCEINDKTLYMDIMVLPQYQRKGIASGVLRDIQSDKLRLDFDTIKVSIDESNIASVALFEKMGFEYISKEDELITYVYKLP